MAPSTNRPFGQTGNAIADAALLALQHFPRLNGGNALPMPTPQQAAPSTSGVSGEPAPGSPEALALLAALGIAGPTVHGVAAPADPRFSREAVNKKCERLIKVRELLDQLTVLQKELHDYLRLAHLRGDLRHLLPADGEGGYQLPGGVQLHRRSGRRQWHYSPVVQELVAQLKARQLYEQGIGQASSSIGPAFWELRFPKG